MLKIRFGTTEDTIRKVSKFFDVELENHWLEDQMVRDMIKDVDKSEVIEGRNIESSVLGAITPKELSGGVKALILMLFQPEYEYYGTACGDNCSKWILEIAEKHDLTLSFTHIMKFPEPFEIFVVNSGKTIRTMLELVCEKDDYDIANREEYA